MANQTIFQTRIIPQKPKVLQEERVFVYVPKASTDTPGIAAFNSRDFALSNGLVSLNWPIQLQIERLSDPLTEISRVKLLNDEFEATGSPATLTNPITGAQYTSSTAELKIKRTNRNAFTRPDLVMLDNISDFEASTDENQYVKYRIKRNNPLEQPSLVWLNQNDFKRDVDTKIKINWPIASESPVNTNGLGLVKIADDKSGYLEYSNLGILQVAKSKLVNDTIIKPEYEGTLNTGFYDIAQFVDTFGYPKLDENGHPILSISKRAVGLSKVENKAFNEYTYNELSDNIRNYLSQEFDSKLDVSRWDTLFIDWNPPSQDKNTVQKWFTSLELEDDSIRQTIRSIRYFLGYFETEDDLIATYPPTRDIVASYAFVVDAGHYFAVREGSSVDIYEWYDTGVVEVPFAEYMEKNADAYKPNGIPAPGTSGLWAQSDHVHPVDDSRLAKSIYKDTNVTINSDLEDSVNDFKFNLWEEDESGQYLPNRTVNVPYVRKSKSIHNWQGQYNNFVDTAENSELYWAGSKQDFISEAATLPNGTLIIVDDLEDENPENFILQSELERQGIVVDPYSYDRFVTLDARNSDDLVSAMLTLEKVKNPDNSIKYIIKPILANEDDNKLLVTKNRNGVTSISTKNFDENSLIVNSNGELSDITIHPTSIIATNKDGLAEVLSANKLLISGDNNTLKVFDTTDVVSRAIVSDGFGGVSVKVFSKDNLVLISGDNGDLTESTLNLDNVLVSSMSDTSEILTAGQILISKTGNQVGTVDTGGVPNKLIVADGLGGIKLSAIPSGKLVYTSAQGVLSAFPVTASDAGKILGVSSVGDIILTDLPEMPKTNPVSTYTVDPGDQINGTVLCILDSDPMTYSEGVLYLW